MTRPVLGRHSERKRSTSIASSPKKAFHLTTPSNGDTRDAVITDENGDTIFEQKSVEIPKSWSQMATNIVASKYFHGTLGTGERENSVRQLIGRVVDTITRWGQEGSYFQTNEDAETFRDDLTFLLLNQHASFNSPVWFNCGIEAKPQCSACFINSVDDTMDSILSLAKTEGMLFKWGSGTGSNLSTIRSSRERLSGGRYRERAGLLHERLRRVRGRDPKWGQDETRGQDGHFERRPSRHHGLHRVQAP